MRNCVLYFKMIYGSNWNSSVWKCHVCQSIVFAKYSDREITQRSGFLGLDFKVGDSVMADKGFDIQDLLDDKVVRLNIPPSLGQCDQMTENEVKKTQSIAADRWKEQLIK